MKRIQMLWIVMMLCFAGTMMAQPTFSIDNVFAHPDETVTVDVTARDFTDITKFTFGLDWDTTQLQFLEVVDAHIALANGLEVVVNPATQNIDAIAFESSNDLGATLLETNNQALMFRLVFSVTGAAMMVNTIDFGGVILVNRVNTGTSNIGLIRHAGSVTIVEEGLHIYASDETISSNTLDNNPEPEICVDVRAIDFIDIVHFQFGMEWDSTILEFDRVQHFGLPDLVPSSFGTDSAGHLNVFWLENSLSSVSLANNDTLFQVCFKVIGECEEVSLFDFPYEVDFTLFLDFQEDEVVVNYISGSATICPQEPEPEPEPEAVWPGDTDTNRIVNHFDLLPLGLSYGASGPLRFNASLDWEAQDDGSDWDRFTPISETDYKHSDTNGNGEINFLDIQAIIQNWGLTHDFAPDAEDEFFNSNNHQENIPFYIFPDSDTLQESLTYALPLVLGTSDIMANAVYGLAFSLKYNPDIIVPESAYLDFQNSWLGTIDSDMYSIQKDHPSEGRLDVAITRIDGANVGGSGTIGHFFITIEDDILLLSEEHKSPFSEVYFSIENVRLIDYSEQSYTVRSVEPDMEIVSKTEEVILSDLITIYPNPTTDFLTIIEQGLSIEKVELVDVMGRLIFIENEKVDMKNIDLINIETGIYVLKIHTNRGLVLKKVAVE